VFLSSFYFQFTLFPTQGITAIKLSAHHLAPQDRFWDSLSQKSIRHEANLLGSSRPASATDYAQKTLHQGYHKWLYGSSG
jgi:hypothetical protein